MAVVLKVYLYCSERLRRKNIQVILKCHCLVKYLQLVRNQNARSTAGSPHKWCQGIANHTRFSFCKMSLWNSNDAFGSVSEGCGWSRSSWSPWCLELEKPFRSTTSTQNLFSWIFETMWRYSSSAWPWLHHNFQVSGGTRGGPGAGFSSRSFSGSLIHSQLK